jgi:hypothetical protein
VLSVKTLPLYVDTVVSAGHFALRLGYDEQLYCIYCLPEQDTQKDVLDQ